MPSIEIGSIVTNTRQPAWGPGKVFSIGGDCMLVGFRDRPVNERFVRVTPKCLELAAVQADPVLDGLAVRFDSHCRVVSTPRTRGGRVLRIAAAVTSEQALEHFLRVYPDGFAGAGYEAAERAWKWDKHVQWNELFPGDQFRDLAHSDPVEAGRRLLKVVQTERGTLLTPRLEIVALKDGLSTDASRRYLMALADFLEAEAGSQGAFDDMKEALTSLPVDHSTSRIATWPILTVVPFLARPDRHMLLKPTATTEAARQLGYDLQYSSALRWETYRRLRELAADLFAFLEPHGARDYIDVQSFLQVLVRKTEPAPATGSETATAQA